MGCLKREQSVRGCWDHVAFRRVKYGGERKRQSHLVMQEKAFKKKNAGLGNTHGEKSFLVLKIVKDDGVKRGRDRHYRESVGAQGKRREKQTLKKKSIKLLA